MEESEYALQSFYRKLFGLQGINIRKGGQDEKYNYP
jgi:hypothetical protein